ncbi:hypothetical protein GS511_07200 [Leptospira borgpetersenii]|uniref:Uncharacterized protein n=1 Tax=Leptospira borgpetersenii serovar Ballum TaxID=280505 RepID=A0A0E3B4J5_LEPBO|nr:hypothetical protein LBBP_01752 [Leptospira borgpetersenii serovar Ballum]ANH00801.1 Uncharacterized protein LB4E_1424 [Leptospira borgpetersenii str. 4E]EKR01786.1 hypothetical protein LEP1GSC121_4131 [Leptospira borgpetersenii serovar Castellonis str. 200801910]EMO10261.1 hypothetical protein LEP1GSC137_0668 [Leptospira borgpetersenii str. Noumea 25]QHE26791.1 hypothetical protein GS524_07195 [Leptospira borgpetersenii]
MYQIREITSLLNFFGKIWSFINLQNWPDLRSAFYTVFKNPKRSPFNDPMKFFYYAFVRNSFLAESYFQSVYTIFIGKF